MRRPRRDGDEWAPRLLPCCLKGPVYSHARLSTHVQDLGATGSTGSRISKFVEAGAVSVGLREVQRRLLCFRPPPSSLDPLTNLHLWCQRCQDKPTWVTWGRGNALRRGTQARCSPPLNLCRRSLWALRLAEQNCTVISDKTTSESTPGRESPDTAASFAATRPRHIVLPRGGRTSPPLNNHASLYLSLDSCSYSLLHPLCICLSSLGYQAPR
jgi:hypothetical protein